MIITHMGNAVVKFDDVFTVEPEFFKKFKNSLESTIDNRDSIKNGKNTRTEGGYEIPQEHANESPVRYTNLHSLNDKDANFLKYLQDSIHKCMIEYCKIFPVVVENIRWVTNGYVIKYENGQCIGPHSDCNIAYADDGVTILNSIPVYNVLTAGAFLNDDFEGGQISWRIWGINSKPKVGSVFIYPSSFVGCHEVAPVTDGTRYAYLRWYGHGEPEFNSAESVMHLLEDIKAKNTQQKFVPVGVVNN